MNATMSRFVVGVDGSAAAASAMRWAGMLATASDVEIVAVNAWRVSGVRVGGVAMKVLHRASLPLVLVPPVLPA